MSADNSDDVDDETWCAASRQIVLEYLALQTQKFGALGAWPAWHIAPYVSVWAVESIVCPGDVGWWVICGDLPTDYASAKDVGTPREAVATFARRWQTLSGLMEKCESHPDMVVGTKRNAAELAPLLKSRAKILDDWAQDDSFWDQTL